LDEQRTDGFIPEHRDEQYWRRMADDAKECAATLNASQLKDQLLMLAERCERVAERDKWRQIANCQILHRGACSTSFDLAQPTPQGSYYNRPRSS
jgi:hypothetical protein